MQDRSRLDLRQKEEQWFSEEKIAKGTKGEEGVWEFSISAAF